MPNENIDGIHGRIIDGMNKVRMNMIEPNRVYLGPDLLNTLEMACHRHGPFAPQLTEFMGLKVFLVSEDGHLHVC